jgi:hypothetical protein
MRASSRLFDFNLGAMAIGAGFTKAGAILQ